MLIKCGPLGENFELNLEVEPLEADIPEAYRHRILKRNPGCGNPPFPECCYGSCG